MLGVEHMTVMLADSRDSERERVASILGEAGMHVTSASTGGHALDLFYANPPQCLLVRSGMTSPDGKALVNEIKQDNVYGHLPVILICDPEEIDQGMDWNTVIADDYLIEPLHGPEVISRMGLCIARAQRDVNLNPLTGLPGNLTITREAERRLAAHVPFGFAHVDVDGFKAFNDIYGFSRGDEVLRMTGRMLVNAIRSLKGQDTYVGHIGGDDFVFITPPNLIATASQHVIKNFDLLVPNFYDKKDRDRGYIEALDRQERPCQYPIITVSIGAVDTSVTQVTHIADLYSRVSEVKTLAKRIPGSTYLIDRRRK